eukprot:CAMPEP_0180649638 /NCGR_PEP_ID=MMETSP1037_2-20121125/51717_1 /TAXON_ID=632150 /ORGANISM="Azadinium spinosum, Strain 3D9" /LENGTH=124 /DNA_ID=CAMNT_0022674751 /DNA_START=159 /DNA_END=533 /DNA_ORIENTATION=-
MSHQDVSRGEGTEKVGPLPLGLLLLQLLCGDTHMLKEVGFGRLHCMWSLPIDHRKVRMLPVDVERLGVELRHQEEAPLVVHRPLLGPMLRHQAPELVTKVGVDGSALAEDEVAVLQARYLPMRI